MKLKKTLLLVITTVLFITSGVGYAALSLKLVNTQSGTIKFLQQEKTSNILLLGSDSRSDSIKGRSDSIMVVRIDPKNKSVKMVSFPRDARVRISGRGFNKINAAFAYGGPELAVKTIEDYANIKIDGYVAANFRGFIGAVNNLEGVQITLDKKIHDRQAGPFLNAGPQRLNGLEALAMARSRKAVQNGDFGRAANQQKIVKAFIEQEQKKSTREMLSKTVRVLPNFKTNVSLLKLISLGLAVRDIQGSDIEGVVLSGSTKTIGGASSIVLDDGFARNAFKDFN